MKKQNNMYFSTFSGNNITGNGSLKKPYKSFKRNWLEKFLSKWYHKLKCKKNVIIAYKIGQPKSKEITMLELTITNEQKIKVSLTPVTATGKPAKLDGVPAWNISSGPATIQVADDGLSAELISDDNDLTDTIIQVDADADLGSGVETISDTITLHTIHANATNVGLTAGTPEPK